MLRILLQPSMCTHPFCAASDQVCAVQQCIPGQHPMQTSVATTSVLLTFLCVKSAGLAAHTNITRPPYSCVCYQASLHHCWYYSRAQAAAAAACMFSEAAVNAAHHVQIIPRDRHRPPAAATSARQFPGYSEQDRTDFSLCTS
jgi:hypothetical protein